MTAVGVGVGVAALAALCYELGYVVQVRAARTEGDDRLRPGLLARLVRRRTWLAGTAGAACGAALQVLALALAPLSVVQPTLALGLVLLLVLARNVLGERPGPRELLGVAAVIAGVAGVALAAPPAGGAVRAGALAALIGGLAVVVALPFLFRERVRDPRASVAAAAAGDVVAALALKLVADALGAGTPFLAGGFVVLAAVAGLLALTAEMSALQAMAASHVAPVIVAAQVAVPVAAAPLVFGEDWGATPLGGLALGAAVAVVAGGAALLGSSAPVAGRRRVGGAGEDQLGG